MNKKPRRQSASRKAAEIAQEVGVSERIGALGQLALLGDCAPDAVHEESGSADLLLHV